jgi:hypothetical protein
MSKPVTDTSRDGGVADGGSVDVVRTESDAAETRRLSQEEQRQRTDIEYVDDNPAVELLSIEAVEGVPLGTAQHLAFDVRYDAERATPVLVHVTARFPDGLVAEQLIDAGELVVGDGTLRLTGIECERGGLFELDVAAYDETGGADYMHVSFPVVPTNPLQVYAYPTTLGSSNWRGAAAFVGNQNLWRCDTRWVLSNGTDHPVRFGPAVRCRVSDAGLGQLADFTFSITPFDVAAWSSATAFIFTTHGSASAVYGQFQNFEDLTFQYTVSTTDGDKTASLVFAPAAFVGVTANFVGDFTAQERSKVVSIIDTWASGIYNDFDCIFRPGTPILVIPQSHGDWARYRDIHVEENKSGNCVDSDEADDLRDGWSSPSQYNDRLDLWFVESFSGDACSSSLGGFSPVRGPVSKSGDDSGVVIDVDDLNVLTSTWGEQVLGVVIAHEVGHFLGLEHDTAAGNFMNATVGSTSTGIRHDQWQTMRKHGFVRR